MKKMGKRFAPVMGRNKRCVWSISTKGFRGAHFAVYPEELCIVPIVAGSPALICNNFGQPKGCGCDAAWGFHPGVVLDPFVGAGTTLKVARDQKRDSIGIDIN